ncbi:MAG: TraR/DksA family transcriptional regulator [Candidatus Binatia bacterium]
MMDQDTINAVTSKLLHQRAVLVGEVADAETDLRFIAEDRETDLEEHAQEERAARLLADLDEHDKRQIEEIDAALRRVAEGTYGICESCEEPIGQARLNALPATRFCIDCARQQEQAHPVITETERGPSGGPVPPDLRLLSDREIEEIIRERVRDDGRVDVEELRIVCRHGVVHLAGALPSEAEHSILRQLITDEFGLEEVEDRIQVKKVLWERDDRTKAAPPEERLPGVEPYGTEDIVESLEEGTDYVPPVRPTPDEE